MTSSATICDCEYLTLAFSPTSVPLRTRWRNNGLSADFLGDYVTTFLPADGDALALEKQQSEIKYAVTYIANELLENAMKYHQPEVDIPITIHLELSSDRIAVSVSNGISAEGRERYQAFLEHLQQENADEQMVRQQEANALDPDSTSSCLGLLTMICDFDARLNWSFDTHPAHSEMMTVTTRAVLPLGEISGEPA